MMNNKLASLPIGIFDSGFGGLTVMRSLKELMPNEDVVYLGDAARLPYGSKSPETIIKYSLECARFLEKQNVKLIVCACHTASSIAASVIREALSIPLIDMVEPSVTAALCLPDNTSLAILATRSTILSGIYQKKLLENKKHLRIKHIACPLFAPIIEEGITKGPIANEVIKHYLAPLKKENIEVLLLACTHYPLLTGEIYSYMEGSCSFLDPGISCALFIKEYLENHQLKNEKNFHSQYHFFTTDDVNKFQSYGEQFFQDQIANVIKVAL
ncbi:MAG: glutamate racemase [Chlamydiae bacterium]|nr:glutamate racemase [Chlamydiota bacterium]